MVDQRSEHPDSQRAPALVGVRALDAYDQAMRDIADDRMRADTLDVRGHRNSVVSEREPPQGCGPAVTEVMPYLVANRPGW